MKEYVKKYADFINESFINESNTEKYFDLMIKQGYLDNIVRELDGYEDNSIKQNLEYQYKIVGEAISEFSKKNNIKLNGHDEDNLLEMILDEYFPDSMNEGGNFRIKYDEYDLGKGVTKYEGIMLKRMWISKETKNGQYKPTNMTVNFSDPSTFDFLDKRAKTKADYFIVQGMKGNTAKEIEICITCAPGKKVRWKEKDVVQLWNAEKNNSEIMLNGRVIGVYKYSDIGGSYIHFDKPMPIYNFL